jgi:2-oxoglutarate ferredoxin oxidoreductase subunit alpha
MTRTIDHDLVIVLAGEAGQGIQSIESILSSFLKKNGFHFYSTSEFMSRVRGGTNSTEIRVSSRRVSAFRNRIDLLIPLHAEAVAHLGSRVTDETLILGDKAAVKHESMIDVPFTQIAKETGSALYANTVAAGCICGLLKVDAEEGASFMYDHFSTKTDEVREKNREAFLKGYEAGTAIEAVRIQITASDTPKGEVMLSGSDAVSLGALAAGCDYMCGYPMSPATGVLQNMADYSKRHDIIVEQVEDEVGVVNMALGAWYAGARAFVTTSGGGFALMTEGISLAGMIESPFVLHLAQRPGPATGLPTRTEQGDLDLVLYGGHGDFPRVILAPGTLEEAYTLTQKAFALAEKYQVPAFILTDQYFVDTRYNVPLFGVPETPPDRHIMQTDPDYRRFALTGSGISPRGIPGYGEGLVCADSDEHDESGHITESMDMRVRMVEKRKKKHAALLAEAVPPTLSGAENYKTLVICWGSTKPMVAETLEELALPDVAMLHFSQVFPVPAGAAAILEKAEHIVSVENNSSAQFTRLLATETGIPIRHTILKYDGLPFSVEELAERLSSAVKEGK